MRLRRTVLLALGALAILGSAFAAAGCDDDELDTIDAALLAPPNVPQREDRPAAHVIVRLEATEEVREIAPGTDYRVWTFNGSVPGPLIRVRVGDTVEVRLSNREDSTTIHNIDLHSVNGPGGGAEATTVAPGEEKAFTFKAKAPGLFVYHCAAGIVADHIANGMYGGILVDGPSARQSVDREYYVGQHEYYITDDAGPGGLPTLDGVRLLAEDPTHVVFNGAAGTVVDENALTAETGEDVRLYVANGGPNFTSSFHVIGEIFDRVFEYGATASPPISDISTVLVPAGGAAIVDFRVDVPGDYVLVDHALSRVSKGGRGILRVTGEEDHGTFQDLGVPAAQDPDATPTTGPQPTATSGPAPSPTTSTPGGAAQEVAVEMDDNFFVPDDLSVPAGAQVTFQLTNVGIVPHNMRIADPDGSYDNDLVSVPEIILGGDSGVLEWQAPAEPGVYDFRCDIHPVDMVGTITVEG